MKLNPPETVMIYRHKPLLVQAWHFQEECNKEDIPQWLLDQDLVNCRICLVNLRVSHIILGYGHRARHVPPGNWIAMSEHLEIFGCPHEEFIDKYEKVDIADCEAKEKTQ